MEKQNNTIEDIMEIVITMKKELHNLQQKLKCLYKSTNKQKKTNVVSGFVTPVNVKQELATFLNIEKDEKVSRSVVNKKINEYIVKHDLQIQDKKQWFMIDDNLSKIFTCEKGEQMHYFKMQTYLKHNYIKV